LSYYNKGEDSYSDILGGGGKNFQIKGGQIKLGICYITNLSKLHFQKKRIYNLVGFGVALSYYNIYHEVGLKDYIDNQQFFPRTLDFYTRSIDFQCGKIINFNQSFYMKAYLNIGIVNSYNVDGIPINKLPAIGYIGSNSGLFVNGCIELYYNIYK
jgi:hypothetical protein